MSENNLTAAVEAAENELSELETERNSMAENAAARAAVADASEIVRISSRKKELPLYILAAKLKLETLRLAADQETAESLRKEAGKLRPVVEELQAALQAAKDRRDTANLSLNEYLGRVSRLESKIEDRTAGIERLQRRLGLLAN